MSKRPGGITALAVFNFVFGGIAIITSLLSIAFIENAQKEFEHYGLTVSETVLYFTFSFALVVAVLEVISGIGYLRLKNKMGKQLGTIFAISSIIYTATQVQFMEGATGFMVVPDFAYPVITLFLLHLTFRDDFTAE